MNGDKNVSVIFCGKYKHGGVLSRETSKNGWEVIR